MGKSNLFEEVHLTNSEIPNEETIKAMEDEELFTADSAEEMIRDCIGDPHWTPNSH